MLALGISGKFIEERLHLRWGELLDGMNRGFVGPATVVEIAVERVSAGDDVRADVVEIAGAGKEELHGVRDALERLASVQGEAADSATTEKWLCIALAWVFDRTPMFEDAWDVVEQIYTAFDYPKAMKPFVPYEPPPPGVVIGTAEENAARMRRAWKEFLDGCAARFADPSEGS